MKNVYERTTGTPTTRPLLGKLTRRAATIADFTIPTTIEKYGGEIDKTKSTAIQLAKNFLTILQRELMGFFTMANNCRIGFFAYHDAVKEFSMKSTACKIVADMIREKVRIKRDEVASSKHEQEGAQSQFDSLYKALTSVWNRMVRNPDFDFGEVMKRGIDLEEEKGVR